MYFIGKDIIFDEDLETHECITPDGVPGKCIELIVCKPLLELLERISVDNPNFKDYLGDSTCGYIQFNPKVYFFTDSFCRVQYPVVVKYNA